MTAAPMHVEHTKRIVVDQRTVHIAIINGQAWARASDLLDALDLKEQDLAYCIGLGVMPQDEATRIGWPCRPEGVKILDRSHMNLLVGHVMDREARARCRTDLADQLDFDMLPLGQIEDAEIIEADVVEIEGADDMTEETAITYAPGTTHTYGQHAIVSITDAHGNPWFVAKQVCDLLGYENSRKAVQDHCKSPEMLKSNESLRLDFEVPPRGMTIINQGDVNRLIARSRTPEAERIQDWWYDTVLASYMHGTQIAAPAPQNVLALPDGMHADAAKHLQAFVETVAREGNVAQQEQIRDLEAVIEGQQEQMRIFAGAAKEQLSALSKQVHAVRTSHNQELERLGNMIATHGANFAQGTIEPDKDTSVLLPAHTPPEWDGGKEVRSTANLPLDDVLMVYFKRRDEARQFISLLRWFKLAPSGTGRDSNYQMEFGATPSLSDLAVARKYIVPSDDGDNPSVLPNGRGAIEATLGFHAHKFDTRTPTERQRLKKILVGRIHAGELPELRSAYAENRSPKGTSFCGLVPKKIEGSQ